MRWLPAWRPWPRDSNAPDPPAMNSEAILRLSEAIAEDSLRGASEGDLLQGLCARAVAAGLPLKRAALGIDTLHPVLGGHLFVWNRDTPAVRRDEYKRSTGLDESEGWLNSPFNYLLKSGECILRRRIENTPKPADFPILDDLRAEGATDYLAFTNRFGEGAVIGTMDCVYSSWTGDRPGGFTDDEAQALERLVPILAIAIRGVSVARIAHTLVETYLGHDAGSRVLKGNIERGVSEPIRAVLWLSDLQGFTKIVDRTAADQIVPLLNDYADCLVSAIHANGGQVLKFMGDGILGTFALDTAENACRRALAAGDAAFAGLAEVNKRRSAAGLPITRFDLALHIGEVFYGNIGSAERLDFTVVGPAVNELARIEAMGRSLEQEVILSSAFAASAGESRGRLVSLGRYALRGVSEPQELFTLLRPSAG